jgi:hypothetical protein
LARQAHEVEPSFHHVGEPGAVVTQNVGEPPVQDGRVIFRVNEECRPLPRRHSEPVAREDVGDGQMQLCEALAHRAWTGEYRSLVKRDAVVDGPLLLRHGLVVPARHIDQRDRHHLGRLLKLLLRSRYTARSVVVSCLPACVALTSRCLHPAA